MQNSTVPKFITDSISQVDSIFTYIDKSLGGPEDVASKMEKTMQMQVYTELKPILRIVEDIIIKHKCVLYGGTALNMLLPSEYKFYDETEIPDYDFFSPSADTLAIQLADKLTSEGYKYTEVKHAMHPGTYKVFCNFEVVADITNIPSKEHKILINASEKVKLRGKKIMISPIPFLKALAYKELCMPLSSSFRWTKVYKRLLLTESAYPTKLITDDKDLLINQCKYVFEKNQTIYQDTYIIEAHRILKRIVEKLKQPYCGLDACEMYLRQISECKRYFDNRESQQITGPIEILSDDPSTTMKHIKKEFHKQMNTTIRTKVQVEQTFEEFYPDISTLVLLHGKKSIVMLKLIDCSKNCFAVIENNKKMYASIFFLYYMTYMKILLKSKDAKYNQLLIIMLSRYLVNQEESDLFEKFTSKCYGNEKSMLDIRKENWDSRKKIMFYRPK